MPGPREPSRSRRSATGPARALSTHLALQPRPVPHHRPGLLTGLAPALELRVVAALVAREPAMKGHAAGLSSGTAGDARQSAAHGPDVGFRVEQRAFTAWHSLPGCFSGSAIVLARADVARADLREPVVFTAVRKSFVAANRSRDG